jgi:hypothetical protein
MWRAQLLPNGQHHVTPIADHRNHQLSAECWCHPFDDEGVYVHNSLDGREFYERGERKAS